MNQSRRASLVEAVLNTLIGLVVSFAAWPVAAAWFDIAYTVSGHFGVTGFFTVLSVARGYVVRRWFNARLRRLSERLVGNSR